MIGLKKIEDIGYLAFQNALRLHSDAISLYRQRRYPSAFLLAILAQEEIGKMHLANDFVFHNRNGARDENLENQWLALFYKHPHKQHAFLRNSPLDSYGARRSNRFIEKVFEGDLEARKQTATYVGLSRKKGKIDIKAKIKHPFHLKRTAAAREITKINDYLLFISMGARTGSWMQDIEEIESQIKSKRFLLSTAATWSERSPTVVKIIKTWRDQLGARLIPRI